MCARQTKCSTTGLHRHRPPAPSPPFPSSISPPPPRITTSSLPPPALIDRANARRIAFLRCTITARLLGLRDTARIVTGAPWHKHSPLSRFVVDDPLRALRCSATRFCGARSTTRERECTKGNRLTRLHKHTVEHTTRHPPRLCPSIPSPILPINTTPRLPPPSCRRSARPFIRATPPRQSTTTQPLTMETTA